MLIYILIVAFIHLLITSPSLIYHKFYDIYYRLTANALCQTVLKDKKVVVFVHGRGGHYSNFIPLINNLKYKIPQDYHLKPICLGNNKHTSVDDDVYNLQIALQLYPDCEITLIGLSKGGVVILRYITTIKDSRIKKAITISSPLMGTRMTQLLSSESITNKELGFRSELSKDLEMSNINVPIYHVVPRWDHVINPTSSAAYPNTPQSNIYYYNGTYSHTGIIYSNDVANTIASWLII